MDGNKQTSPDNIDQIRNLIFGEQIQDYDRRFQELVKKLDGLKKMVQTYKDEADNQFSALEKRLNQSIADLQAILQKDLKNQIQSVRQDLHSLEEKQDLLSSDKLDRNQLADQLINLAMQLKGESILDQIKSGVMTHE